LFGKIQRAVNAAEVGPILQITVTHREHTKKRIKH